MDWQDDTMDKSLFHKLEDLSSVSGFKGGKGRVSPEAYPLIPHTACQASAHGHTHNNNRETKNVMGIVEHRL